MRHRLTSGALLLLASCGHPARPAEHPSPAPSAVSVTAPAAGRSAESDSGDSLPSERSRAADPFAALFEEGRSFRGEVRVKESYYDGEPRTDEARGAFVCTVGSVEHLEWGAVAELTCEGVGDQGIPDPVTGFWVATSTALHHTKSRPTSELDLTDDTRRFALPPSPEERTSPATPEGHVEVSEIASTEHGWCSELRSSAGDEAWRKVCFAAARGLTHAEWGWAGGSTHESVLDAAD